MSRFLKKLTKPCDLSGAFVFREIGSVIAPRRERKNDRIPQETRPCILFFDATGVCHTVSGAVSVGHVHAVVDPALRIDVGIERLRRVEV